MKSGIIQPSDFSLHTFFQKFELFADAPNAVGKIRELVLQLAIQGKLVDQHEKDEPADKLFEKIQTQRNRLVSNRSIRKQKLTPVGSDEMPFSIPESWYWTRLGEIGDWGSGSTPARGNHDFYDGEITWLKSGELNDNQALAGSKETITELALRSGSFRRNTPGDLLLAMYGATIGKAAILAESAVTNQAVCGCTPFKGVLNRYLFNFLLSQRARFHFASEGGAQPNISKLKIVGFPFALPPLAEQKRIVAKVDELMALCDRLEAQQQERQTRHAALARASLARFADAPTPANLDYLFYNTCTITSSNLRKSILALAVQGKLVPQDPNDEPAEQCLSRLGLKSTAASLNRTDVEDNSLPSSWMRVRFEDIALVTGGVTIGRKLGERKTVILPYLRVANVKRGQIDLTVIKDVSIGEDEVERYALRKNDLLMTEGGDWDKVGRAAIWKSEIAVCLHQNHVFRARMRSAEIAPFWFERYFNSPIGRSYFESASKQTTNLASINMRQVRICPVPLPPLAEQRRIVAKVDQLMALVDRLEAHLAAAKTMSVALLDAAIHELTHPRARILEFPVTKRDPLSDRAAIGCYVIRQMAGKPFFGRTTEMKLLYLVEVHLGLNLGGKYVREAAGPLDDWIYRFQEEAGREGWFDWHERKIKGGRTKIEYRPGPKLNAKASLATSVFTADQRIEFDRLLNLFADKKTEQAEIIATLFAAWNDLLLDGISPKDEKIIHEVRENWHPDKARFTPAHLQQWLDWMKQNQLVPKGQKPRTKQQLDLLPD